MKKEVTVSAVGADAEAAVYEVLGGWFGSPDVSSAAATEAHQRGEKVFRFRLTAELIEEVLS